MKNIITMKVDELNKLESEMIGKDLFILKAIAGSHAYGLNNEFSDIDYRGIYKQDTNDYFKLDSITDQIKIESSDINYYGLGEFVKLALKSNPNIIELLYMPDECIVHQNKDYATLKKHAHLFISKMAYDSYVNYAKAQIKRAKGKNKKVMNPQPLERPNQQDFLYFINYIDKRKKYTVFSPNGYVATSDHSVKHEIDMIGAVDRKLIPGKPLKINETDVKLSECNAAGMEKMPNCYRLYHYGKNASGVVENNGRIKTSSIPIHDESTHFVGILYFDQPAYEKAKADWSSYHEWVKNRNENRWIKQESGLLDYDAKNMTHTFRLFYSGLNILEKGEPLVRMPPNRIDFLMNIRNGLYSHEELMTKAYILFDKISEVEKKSKLPDEPDYKKVNQLYSDILKRKRKKFFFFR